LGRDPSGIGAAKGCCRYKRRRLGHVAQTTTTTIVVFWAFAVFVCIAAAPHTVQTCSPNCNKLI